MMALLMIASGEINFDKLPGVQRHELKVQIEKALQHYTGRDLWLDRHGHSQKLVDWKWGAHWTLVPERTWRAARREGAQVGHNRGRSALHPEHAHYLGG